MSSGNHLTCNNSKDFALGVLSLLSPALFLATPSLVLYINTHHPPRHTSLFSPSTSNSFPSILVILHFLLLAPFTHSSERHRKCLLPREAFLGNPGLLLADSILILSLTKYYLLGLFPSVSILATLQIGIYLISPSSAW